VAPTERIDALNPVERALYEGTVLADVALRTALGSWVRSSSEGMTTDL
jgi:hypothetical protein